MASKRAAQGSETSARAETLWLVIQTLSNAPENINPCARLYYELCLEYTFGSLDIGTLLLHRETLAETVKAGGTEQELVKAICSRLKNLHGRSSHYVPL